MTSWLWQPLEAAAQLSGGTAAQRRPAPSYSPRSPSMRSARPPRLPRAPPEAYRWALPPSSAQQARSLAASGALSLGALAISGVASETYAASGSPTLASVTVAGAASESYTSSGSLVLSSTVVAGNGQPDAHFDRRAGARCPHHLRCRDRQRYVRGDRCAHAVVQRGRGRRGPVAHLERQPRAPGGHRHGLWLAAHRRQRQPHPLGGARHG